MMESRRRRDLERLYDAYAESVLRFLLYRTGDAALAEDLAADAFERIMRTRRPFDPRKGSEKTWIYAIALNVLRDHARRRGAEERALERHGDPHDDAVGLLDSERVELRAVVAHALKRLNADEREAVALRYGADLTVAQIAAVTGAKPVTVEKRLYRALGKLREELSPDLARS